jgi:hypothetical protein
MPKAVFEGLVRDEHDRPCPVVFVGAEPTYVLTESGFRYHIDARKVDQQVMEVFAEQVKSAGPEATASAMKMLGGNVDLFTKAQIDHNIKHFDQHMPKVFESGIPDNARAMLGMMGFHITINRHGDVVKLDMPSRADDDDGR